MSKADGDDLVAKAFRADQHAALAEAVDRLSPDEAQFFLDKLERAIRKRKLQLTGYLVAMLVWVLGTFGALVYYGTHDGFVAWVFLVPFLFVGLVLYGFGKWAERIGGPDAPRTPARGGDHTLPSPPAGSP